MLLSPHLRVKADDLPHLNYIVGIHPSPAPSLRRSKAESRQESHTRFLTASILAGGEHRTAPASRKRIFSYRSATAATGLRHLEDSSLPLKRGDSLRILLSIAVVADAVLPLRSISRHLPANRHLRRRNANALPFKEGIRVVIPGVVLPGITHTTLNHEIATVVMNIVIRVSTRKTSRYLFAAGNSVLRLLSDLAVTHTEHGGYRRRPYPAGWLPGDDHSDGHQYPAECHS